MSVRGGAAGECLGAEWLQPVYGPECTSNKENSKRKRKRKSKRKSKRRSSNNHGQGCRSLVQWICVPSHKLCSLYDRHVDKFFSLVSAFSMQLSPLPNGHRYKYTSMHV